MSFLGKLFNTPSLIEAVEEGNLALVRKLIESGADANTRGMFNLTPLMSAAQHGRTDIAAYLLSLPQTNVNAVNNGGTTATSIAIRANNRAIFDMIVADKRFDVNTIGNFGCTALIEAAGSGKKDYVAVLLKIPGIRHEATYTTQKYTPAAIARKNGFDDVAAMIETHFTVPPQQPPAPRP